MTEATLSLLCNLRNAIGQKTDRHLKMAAILKNKNYDHFTPISGQGSAPIPQSADSSTSKL